MDDKERKLRANIQYTSDFQDMLEEVAANALGGDRLFMELYTSEDKADGMFAAEAVGLSVKEGVAYFVFLQATLQAEHMRRKGLFSRLSMRLSPKPNSVEESHIAMTNYVLNELLGGYPDKQKLQ
jgi:hypothetical protein